MKALCISLIICTLFSACKKKENNSSGSYGTTKTTKELLIGEWDIHHQATDNNHNGTMDNDEKFIRNHDQQWKIESGERV